MKLPTKLLLCLSFGLLPVSVYAYPTGAPFGYTGAPGDQNCITSGCHTGTTTPNSTSISLKFPNGATYTAGTPQTLTVTASDSFAVRYGFEITARLASNAQAGNLTTSDTSVAHVVCASDCSTAGAIQDVTHSTPRTDGTWNITWTPPPAGSGAVTFYLAVNASAGAGPTNKHIHLQSFPVTEATAAAVPTVAGVANAASFVSSIAPGAYFAIAGTNLSTTNPGRTWATGDFTNGGKGLPLSLDGTSVTVNGKPAYVYFVSPTQVNAIAPADATAAGQKVPVVVTLNGQVSQQFMVEYDAVSPAFFTDGAGKYVVAQDASTSFSLVGPVGLIPGATTAPAKSGDTVVFYASGCGPTTPAAPDGSFVSQASPLIALPTVTVGGVQATVAFGGLVPPYAGLYQFNVVLPANLPSGDQPVIATLPNGAVSKSELITIQ